MDILFDIVHFASIGSPVVGIFLFFFFRNKHAKAIKILLLFMVVSLLCDVLAYALARMKVSNIFIVNLFFIFQLLMVCLIYMKILPVYARIYKTVVSTFFLSVLIINGLVLQDFYNIQNYSWGLSTLMLIVIAYSHIVHLASHQVPDVGTTPGFWISTGIFFYGSLSVVVLTVSKYLAMHHSTEDFEYGWIFHNAANIFKNSCFAAAIWWSAKQNVESLPNNHAMRV